MIDYQTSCEIRKLRDETQLTLTQIAGQLGLHRQTVAAWKNVRATSVAKRSRPGGE